ncbi:hypothetical protein ACFE04_029978 [Oxalis oulophora]
MSLFNLFNVRFSILLDYSNAVMIIGWGVCAGFAKGQNAGLMSHILQTFGVGSSKFNNSSPHALISQSSSIHSGPDDSEEEETILSKPMGFVRGILEGDRLNQYDFNSKHDPDFVHIRLLKNNTFVTVTDSKGNRKIGASSGGVPGMKGGPTMSRYAAEATAEHVGRMSQRLGLKSVVMKVKGFTHFKKKRQAIMSFKEGLSTSRTDRNPIICIEDATRKPHNGCRRPRKRRI